MPDGEPARGPVEATKKALAGSRDRLVAALELLRERQHVTLAEEQEIVSTYEHADAPTRHTIEDLVERLEEANFGQVAIQLTQEAREGVGAAIDQALQSSGLDSDEKRRRAIQSASVDIRKAGGDFVEDMVTRGRQALLQSDTQEMERVFLRWTMDTVSKLETGIVRAMVGLGVIVLLVAGLWGLHRYEEFRYLVEIVAIVALAVAGLLVLVWSSRIKKWAEDSRGELQAFIDKPPSERLQQYGLEQAWPGAAAKKVIPAATSARTPPPAAAATAAPAVARSPAPPPTPAPAAPRTPPPSPTPPAKPRVQMGRAPTDTVARVPGGPLVPRRKGTSTEAEPSDK